MTTRVVCPICNGGVLARADGKLEQSGDSYLPTVVWHCALCEYTRYEPATHAQWLPERAPAPAERAPAKPAPAEPATAAEPLPATPRRAA